jgi:hypothetical protein
MASSYLVSQSFTEEDGTCVVITSNKLKADTIIDSNPDLKTPMFLIFVLDVSGSMQSNISGSKKSKMKIVTDGVISTLNVISNYTKYRDIYIQVITFDTNAKIIIEKTKLTTDSLSEITTFINSINSSGGGTNIWSGTTIANSYLEKSKENEKFVLFMTDGMNNNKDDNPNMINHMLKSGLKQHYIGIGMGTIQEYDVELMSSLFPTVKPCPTGEEITEIILDSTLSKFITAFKNVKITIPAIIRENYNVLSTIESNSENNYELPYISMSQTIPFLFVPKKPIEIDIFFEISFNIGDNIINEIIKVSDVIDLHGDNYTKNYFNLLKEYKNIIEEMGMAVDMEKKKLLKTKFDNLLSRIEKSVPKYDYCIAELHKNLLTEIKSALIDFNTMMNPSVSYGTQYAACQSRIATSNYMSSGGYQTSSIGYVSSSMLQKNNKSLDPQPLTYQQGQLPVIPEEKQTQTQSSFYNTYNSIKKLIFKQ